MWEILLGLGSPIVLIVLIIFLFSRPVRRKHTRPLQWIEQKVIWLLSPRGRHLADDEAGIAEDIEEAEPDPAVRNMSEDTGKPKADLRLVTDTNSQKNAPDDGAS